MKTEFVSTPREWCKCSQKIRTGKEAPGQSCWNCGKPIR